MSKPKEPDCETCEMYGECICMDDDPLRNGFPQLPMCECGELRCQWPACGKMGRNIEQ